MPHRKGMMIVIETKNNISLKIYIKKLEMQLTNKINNHNVRPSCSPEYYTKYNKIILLQLMLIKTREVSNTRPRLQS